MKTVAVLVFLSFVSLGQSAPDCETLLKPISLNHEGLVGKYLYIGGTSGLPGSRSLTHAMTGVWIESSPTSQSNVFELIQAQRVFGKCYNMKFNMTVENGALVIRNSFYVKDDFLMADCPECVTLYETAVFGEETFKSLLLFSKSKTVPSSAVDMLKKQAECLKMPSVIMMNQDYEMCPDDPAPLDGIEGFKYYLEAKTGHVFARILDAIFDLFVN